MGDTDQQYFQGRAEAELELAKRANHPAAVNAHHALAGRYYDPTYNGADNYRKTSELQTGA
ncbi:hypothetical protein [Sphingomonas sp. PB2P19]|uniref:hypothetical protein n=1 Tax=Sphingomonas rhamnosi TaxID=3096156 RepID=UPI002FC6EA9E